MNDLERARVAALEARVAKLEELLKAAFDMASLYPMGKILTKALNGKAGL
jgi:hypothetical protein